MNIYERIDKKTFEMPESLCLKTGQAVAIRDHASGPLDAIWIAFKFGYMQGQKSSQVKGRGLEA